jgi:hypothetical protein
MKPVLALVLLAAAPAFAQTVYRCGADGRIYSQTPCPEGREVDVADPRSAADRQAAAAVAEREAGLADTLRRERLAREAVAARQGAAGFRTAPQPVSAASAPVKAKKKVKARAKKPSSGPRAAGT